MNPPQPYEGYRLIHIKSPTPIPSGQAQNGKRDANKFLPHGETQSGAASTLMTLNICSGRKRTQPSEHTP